MDYLSRAQLCAELGVSVRTYERYLARGLLDTIGQITAGGHRRFTAKNIEEIKACLAQHAQSRGWRHEKTGSTTSAGMTLANAERAARLWVREKLARHKPASRRSSSKARPSLPASIESMLD